jgi:hypothetical protein
MKDFRFPNFSKSTFNFATGVNFGIIKLFNSQTNYFVKQKLRRKSADAT